MTTMPRPTKAWRGVLVLGWCLAASGAACKDGAGPARPVNAPPESTSPIVVAVAPLDAGIEHRTRDAGARASFPAPYSFVASGMGTVDLHPLDGDRAVLAVENEQHAFALLLLGPDGITPLPVEGLPKLGSTTSPTKDPLFSRPNPKTNRRASATQPNDAGEWYAGERELGTVVGEWPNGVFLSMHRWAWEPLAWRVTEIYRLAGTKWAQIAASQPLGIVWDLERVWSTGVLAVEQNTFASPGNLQARTWRVFDANVLAPPGPPSAVVFARHVTDHAETFELVSGEGASVVLRRGKYGAKSAELRLADVYAGDEAQNSFEIRPRSGHIAVHGFKWREGAPMLPWTVEVDANGDPMRVVSSAATPADERTRATELARFASVDSISGPRAFIVRSDAYVVGSTSTGEWIVLSTRPFARPKVAQVAPAPPP